MNARMTYFQHMALLEALTSGSVRAGAVHKTRTLKSLERMGLLHKPSTASGAYEPTELARRQKSAVLGKTDPARARRPTKLLPASKIPSYALIIRATWERGAVQKDALDELHRRGGWLSDEQKKQAGLTDPGRSRRRARRDPQTFAVTSLWCSKCRGYHQGACSTRRDPRRVVTQGYDVERIRLNAGGYDRHGRYWGGGAPLFLVTSRETNLGVHVRAASAVEARDEVYRKAHGRWKRFTMNSRAHDKWGTWR